MRCSIKKGVLKNSKFTGKHHLRLRVSFFKKSRCIYNFFLTKEILTQAFSCQLSKMFKNIFFSEPLWITTSEFFKWKKSFWKQNYNRWLYLFWSFTYRSYCIVTNLRRYGRRYAYVVCFACSCLWLVCSRL